SREGRKKRQDGPGHYIGRRQVTRCSEEDPCPTGYFCEYDPSSPIE
ncbi:unnamed protein product, partial [Mesorhabditis spiculigera]